MNSTINCFDKHYIKIEIDMIKIAETNIHENFFLLLRLMSNLSRITIYMLSLLIFSLIKRLEKFVIININI